MLTKISIIDSNFFSGKYKTDVTKLNKVKQTFYHAFLPSSLCCCKYEMTPQKVGGEGSLWLLQCFTQTIIKWQNAINNKTNIHTVLWRWLVAFMVCENLSQFLWVLWHLSTAKSGWGTDLASSRAGAESSHWNEPQVQLCQKKPAVTVS